jgi:hypothetical protein
LGALLYVAALALRPPPPLRRAVAYVQALR